MQCKYNACEATWVPITSCTSFQITTLIGHSQFTRKCHTNPKKMTTSTCMRVFSCNLQCHVSLNYDSKVFAKTSESVSSNQSTFVRVFLLAATSEGESDTTFLDALLIGRSPTTNFWPSRSLSTYCAQTAVYEKIHCHKYTNFSK